MELILFVIGPGTNATRLTLARDKLCIKMRNDAPIAFTRHPDGLIYPLSNVKLIDFSFTTGSLATYGRNSDSRRAVMTIIISVLDGDTLNDTAAQDPSSEWECTILGILAIHVGHMMVYEIKRKEQEEEDAKSFTSLWQPSADDMYTKLKPSLQDQFEGFARFQHAALHSGFFTLVRYLEVLPCLARAKLQKQHPSGSGEEDLQKLWEEVGGSDSAFHKIHVRLAGLLPRMAAVRGIDRHALQRAVLDVVEAMASGDSSTIGAALLALPLRDLTDQVSFAAVTTYASVLSPWAAIFKLDVTNGHPTNLPPCAYPVPALLDAAMGHCLQLAASLESLVSTGASYTGEQLQALRDIRFMAARIADAVVGLRSVGGPGGGALDPSINGSLQRTSVALQKLEAEAIAKELREHVNEAVAAVSAGVGNVQSTVAGVGAELGGIQTAVVAAGAELGGIKAALASMDAKWDGLREEMAAKVAAVAKRASRRSLPGRPVVRLASGRTGKSLKRDRGGDMADVDDAAATPKTKAPCLKADRATPQPDTPQAATPSPLLGGAEAAYVAGNGKEDASVVAMMQHMGKLGIRDSSSLFGVSFAADASAALGTEARALKEITFMPSVSPKPAPGASSSSGTACGKPVPAATANSSATPASPGFGGPMHAVNTFSLGAGAFRAAGCNGLRADTANSAVVTDALPLQPLGGNGGTPTATGTPPGAAKMTAWEQDQERACGVLAGRRENTSPFSVANSSLLPAFGGTPKSASKAHNQDDIPVLVRG